MKQLTLSILISLLLLGCSELRKNRTTPDFLPGDMVVTKFQDTILIIDTAVCCGGFRGKYEIKRKGKAETENMPAAELFEKIN